MNTTVTRPQKEDEKKVKKHFSVVIANTFKEYGFYDKYQKDIDYEVGKQMSALQNYYDNDGKETYCLVAKNNTKIIGTIAYGKSSSDIKKYYKENLENTPEIKSVYILPEYQGKGVGTMLFEAIIKELKQKGFTEFCLDSGYPDAQKFWEKKIGTPVVRITNRWGAGNDYLIWHVKIPQ